jgi:type II secretory pathway pseudopilin PulG
MVVTKKKSFTLIELLLATSLFIIIILVFIVAVWTVMRPKAKNETNTNLQDTSRLVMEEITNNIYKANAKSTEKGYAFFAATGSDGRAIACPATICPTGNRLSTYQSFSDGHTVIRAFGVDLDGGTRKVLQIQELACNPSGTCEPATKDRIHDLSSPDVEVTSISFSGHYWTINAGGNPTNDRSTQAYMEITINLISHYLNNQGTRETLVTKSLVTPMIGDNTSRIINFTY